ncbi:MAG TPA: DUF3592 domain-containing protein [Bryobacteraceae bacterium]|nr:DUF3592 domain-containing protein [Bryobacteraceae bacterium]
MQTLLLWAAFFSPSAILFGLWVRLKVKADASESWPSTMGRVTFCWPGPRYPAVEYTYMVNGEEFSGKRIWFGEARALLPSASAGVAARYPKGGEVMVYYNPEKPRDSVLERRVYAPFTLMMAVIWALCMVPALFVSKP